MTYFTAKQQCLLVELMKIGGVALLYFLLVRGHLLFFIDKTLLSIVWPASGFALAVLLIGGKRYVFSVLLGSFAQLMTATDKSLLVSLLLATAPAIEALLGAWLISRYGKFSVHLKSVRDYLCLLVLAGGISCFVGVFFSSSVLFIEKLVSSDSSYTLESYVAHLLRWWQGDMLGVMLFTPLFLVYRDNTTHLPPLKKCLETLVIVGGAWLVGQIVFLDWWQALFAFLIKGHWLFLFVIVAAVRLGIHSVLFMLFVTMIQALLGAEQGIGLFGHGVADGHFFSYMLSLSVAGIALAIHSCERQVIEQQLRESEDTLHHLFEDSHDAVLLIKNGVFIDCNNAAWTLLGYACKADLIHRPPAYISPAYQMDGRCSEEKANAMIAIALRVGYHRFEWLHCKHDGVIFPVEVTLTRITVRGEIIIHVAWRDITENKQTENALRKSQEQLELVLQGGELGFWDWDIINNNVERNAIWATMLGYSYEEIKTTTQQWLDFIHPEDREKAWQSIEDVLIGNTQVHKIEYRMLCKNGGIKWIGDQARVVQRDADGKPTRMAGIHVDITKQKLAEATLRNSEERFCSLFTQAPLGIALIDSMTGRIYTANQKYADIIGVTLNELQSVDWMRITHPDDIQKDLDNMALMNAGKSNGFSIEKRYIHSDGSIVWVNLTVAPMRITDNSLPRHHCIIEDITERKQAETNLRIAATAFESQESMLVTDANQIIIKANQAVTAMTGYTADEMIGQTPRILSSGRHNKEFYAALWQSIKQRGVWQGEIWNRRKNGEIYPELMTITAVKDDNGCVTHYVSAATDISERKAAEQKIEQFAFYDPLTQLPNRRLLYECLKHGIDANRRDGSQMAVLMLDLDEFKAVNDNFGHAAGDELLQQVAKRITDRLRDVDMVARLGGDEFIVLLEQLRQDNDAGLVANDIIAALSLPFQLSDNHQANIGVSVGISLHPGHGNNPDSLIGNADKALYDAKRRGKGCFAYFQSGAG